MINQDVMESIIKCKRNNILSVLKSLMSDEDNKTDKNIKMYMNAYSLASDDMIHGSVDPVLYVTREVEYLGIPNSSSDGYRDAIYTIYSFIRWEIDSKLDA